jgi:hypothetical protein
MQALMAEIQTLKGMIASQRFKQEWYNVAEVADLFEKKPFTVREWCRLKRINAKHTASGRGNKPEWRIHHDEIERYKNEGLLPLHKQ